MTKFSVLVCLVLIVCLSKHYTVVGTLECNFDSSYCEWRQDNMDNFNWTRMKSSWYWSPVPPSDHTTGEDFYIYVYIDPYQQSEGDKARLISPTQPSGHYCLTFWYIMNWGYFGTFNVYIAMNGGKETVLSTNDRYIRRLDWWKSIFNIKANSSFQIILEGEVGKYSSGYIAVDDISIESGICSLDCDFDDDFCNWIQYDGDNFNWDRWEGSTPTDNTGPTADHTSERGHYIYIETNGKHRYEKAILLSPVQYTGQYCFSFWYYMYGPDVDRLSVQIWFTNGTIQKFTAIQSDQGQQWLSKDIYVSSGAWFQIAIEGRVSYSWSRYRGDIAIDDVKFISCQDCEAPNITNAIFNSTHYKYGSVIGIQCKNGYNLVGETEIVCKSKETWSSTAECIPHDCGDLAIANGTFFTPNGTTLGHVGIQKCDIGFVLVGDPYISCTANGWSNKSAHCNIINCKEFPVPNGKLVTPNGTTFGQLGRHECDNGFSLYGDPVVRCTASGWSNTSSYCRFVDVEPNSSPLVVVYILPSLTVLIFAAVFTILYKRRKQKNCMNLFIIFKKSREVPAKDSVHRKCHSNQIYNNESFKPDEEYATIAEEQTNGYNLGKVYYATVNKSDTNTFGDAKKVDRRKHTEDDELPRSNVKVECSTYNVLSTESVNNNNIKTNEEQDSEYDNACTRQVNNQTSKNDNYSHFGDLAMIYQHTQHFFTGPGKQESTDYSHIESVSINRKCLKEDCRDDVKIPIGKEKKKLKVPTRKMEKLENQAPEYYNIAPSKENANNQSEVKSKKCKEMCTTDESENHDYFVLEKK